MKDVPPSGLYQFIGNDSVGYRRGFVYDLRVRPQPHPRQSTLSIQRVDGGGGCPYGSVEAFLAQWVPVSEELSQALARQRAASERSWDMDRTGWTRSQWVEDARRLMDELDGAVTSLLNGHVLALLDEIDSLRAAKEDTM